MTKPKALPIPHVRCRPVQECRRFLTKHVPGPKTKKKVPPPLLKRIRRRTTARQRQLVVRMVLAKATFRQIADRTALHPVTCRNIYAAFLERKTVVPGKSTGRRPHPIPPDVHQYLQHSLHDHRFLSLRERCRLIQRDTDFPITYTRLRRYFINNHITYRRSKTRLKAGLRALTARTIERHDFA